MGVDDEPGKSGRQGGNHGGGEETPALSDEDVVSRALDESGVDAQRALVVLVQTIVARHLDREFRRLGRRPPYTPGNERRDALVPLMDALHEAMHRNAADYEPVAADLAAVQQVLMQMLSAAQFEGERRAGIDGDDPDDDDSGERPWMRLVRE